MLLTLTLSTWQNEHERNQLCAQHELTFLCREERKDPTSPNGLSETGAGATGGVESRAGARRAQTGWVVSDHGSSVANCFCVSSRCRDQITLNGVVMHSFTGMCCCSGHWDTAASKADRNPVKPLKPSLGSSFTDRDFNERNLKGTQDSTVPCRILPKARPHPTR